ncbi:ankyrin repeat domain-containing protein [Bacillus spongiae]|uniref:Ankyrin repeat domain-containing protein n=1 Tax=Bacillus spongiae TaxID=2683610 RepID=A0ABU8HCX2_9BACI
MNQSKKLVHSNETGLFVVLLVLSIIIYALLIKIFSFIGVFYLALFLLIVFISKGLMVGQIRSNAVKITESQYPEIHSKVVELCKSMSIKSIPDVYVMESSGMLNAFATKLLGRNMVVLFSGVFELIEEEAEDEVTFIIAHELAHIQRKHIFKQLLILPANLVPFLGSAYSRACEYTCDRMAAHYTNAVTPATNGLTVLAIGKQLYSSVDKEAYIQQLKNEKSFFVWLSECLSTHPHLPKRIAEVERFMEMREKVKFPLPLKKLAILSALGFTVTIGGYAALLLVVQSIDPEKIEAFAEALDPSSEEYLSEDEYADDEYAEDEYLTDEEYLLEMEATPLMGAIYYEDYEEFQSLLSNETITETDINGWNALHYASFFPSDEQMLKDLLEAGMLPDTKDNNGVTGIHWAIQSEYASDYKVELLLSSGADPNVIDEFGMTPLMYSIYFPSNIELVEMLLNAGADVQVVDNDGFTALDYATEYGSERLVNLLSE